MKYSFYLLLLVALGGCSSLTFIEGKKIDYKTAAKAPSLEVPPDLTSPTGDDRFAVPDITPQGSATFSAYSRDRQTANANSPLLPESEKVTIERAGSQRWLVVKATPEQLWPALKSFWQSNGFIIKYENPDAGVMETEWAENRAKIPQDTVRKLIGAVLENVYSTSERDKFRTRLERGATPGTTEVYISHRGMVEVLKGPEGSDQLIWQPRPADPELEAEMLRRFMAKLGGDEQRARADLATAATPDKATLQRGSDGLTRLSVAESFDRAWRRVGLALDRVGFTVEDRDRAQGLFFVRYADPEADGAKTDRGGWLSKLAFWRSDSKPVTAERYQVKLTERQGQTEVQVLNASGSKESRETANRILSLLHEQLK